MNSSKLIDLLKTLSSKELRSFRAYIHPPFFNEYKPVSDLFDHIYSVVPDFESHYLKKKNAFSRLFPGKSYYEPRFNNIISDLLGHLEDYFYHIGYSEQASKNRSTCLCSCVAAMPRRVMKLFFRK